MARRQKTFSVIPELMSCLQGEDRESPSRDTQPPMTTKQAKKLYKQKNKGPKLSKAERRKQDLMEQDRIRRELEKEKRLARAEAKREKKKEKEEQEKADKRKKGLPLVDVHPSQDTLARFIRIERPPEPSRERSLTPIIHDDGADQSGFAGEEDARPRKRRRTSKSPPVESDELSRRAEDYAAWPDTEGFDIDHPSVQSSIDQQLLDESFSIDDELFDDVDFDVVMRKGSQVHSAGTHTLVDAHIEPAEPERRSETPSIRLPEADVTCTSSIGILLAKRSDTSDKARLNTRQLLERPIPPSPITADTQRRDGHGTKPEQRMEKLSRRQPLQTMTANEVRVSPPQKVDLHKPAPAIQQPKSRPAIISPGANAFRSPNTPMGPPSVPPKFRSPVQISSKAGQSKFPGPRFLSMHVNVPKTTQPWLQHSGAINRIDRLDIGGSVIAQQSFGGDFDNFFPSPSQEIRELSEEPNHPLASRLKPVKVTVPPMPQPAARPQITAAQKPPKRERREVTNTKAILRPRKHATEAQGSRPIADMPFLSTQDIFLSSQDYRELEESVDSPITSHAISEMRPIKRLPAMHHDEYEFTTPTDSLPTLTAPMMGAFVARGATERVDTVSSQHSNAQPASLRVADRPDPQASLVANDARCADASKTSRCLNSDEDHITLQVEVPVVTDPSPRLSPKPFFTSSGIREQELLAIERSKMTAREDARARLLVRTANKPTGRILPALQGSPCAEREAETIASRVAPGIPIQEAEDEALLLHALEEEERLATISKSLPQQADGRAAQTTQPPPRPKHAKAGSSPYERMMSELAKLHTDKIDHNPILVSEDVEYEYAGWDDDLCEALCP